MASSPYERQGHSFSFTPVQSELGNTSFTEHNSSNSITPRPEPAISFTPVQQELRTITSRNDALQPPNGPLRAPPGSTTPQTSHLTLNLGHLELLYHFIAVTAPAVSAGDLGHEVWATLMPKIALSHEWLMHGLLAMSALHIVHLYPEEGGIYWSRAAMHQDQALQGQQNALANATRENGDALFAFSVVIVYLAFASSYAPSGDEIVPLQGLIECLHMFRGVRAIRPAVRHFVEDSLLAPLLDLHPGNIKSSPAFREGHTEDHFARLLLFASTNADLNEDDDMNDTESFAAAASSLRVSYLKVEAIPVGQPIAPPIWLWAVRLPGSFIMRVRDRQPVPLVLIAHWCVLLAQIHHYWFIQGWVDRTMNDITRCLPAEHQGWLEWPVKKLREVRNPRSEDTG